MQPNFAFDTAAAMEMIPKSKPADFPSQSSPSIQRKPFESSSADDQQQSFNSSLREARRRQADTSNAKPVDDRPDDLQRADRQVSDARYESKQASESTKDGTETVSDQSEQNTDSANAEPAPLDVPIPGEGDEDLENELAGLGAVAAIDITAETADLNLTTGLKPETDSSIITGKDASAAVTPGQMPAGGSGLGSADQGGTPAGLNNGGVNPDANLKVEMPNTGAIAAVEEKPLDSPQSVGANKSDAGDMFQSLTEGGKASQSDVSSSAADGKGYQDSGIGSNSKRGAATRPTGALQPPDALQAEQNANGLKTQAPKTVPVEEASVASTRPAAGEQQNAGPVQADLMQGREGDFRTETVTADDTAPKVVKMNQGGKDGTFMQYQDQNFERLMEPATATREKEASPGLLRTQTIDQIVNRAVYHLKDGQNSVRIDLKPEFLGQVRMQIVTVDQQVSIRIAAELPVVKEMLENNLQQLKTDLQQQGLEVDEIEVSVSTDSRHNTQNQKMKSDLKSQPAASIEEDVDPDLQAAPATTPRTRTGNLAVDMFV